MPEIDKLTDEPVLDHDYDGIKELDNLLPRWWLYLFYFCILFSFVYMAYYHVLHIGYTSAEQYQQEVNPKFHRTTGFNPFPMFSFADYHSPWEAPQLDRKRADLMAGRPVAEDVGPVVDTSPIEFKEPLTDPTSIEAGKAVFTANCVACHGAQGQGGIGPNLTDRAWLHGNLFNDTVQTVVNGVPDKGMITWRGKLTPDEIHQVTSYIYTLRGTNPPNPKAPQGEEY